MWVLQTFSEQILDDKDDDGDGDDDGDDDDDLMAVYLGNSLMMKLCFAILFAGAIFIDFFKIGTPKTIRTGFWI